MIVRKKTGLSLEIAQVSGIFRMIVKIMSMHGGGGCVSPTDQAVVSLSFHHPLSVTIIIPDFSPIKEMPVMFSLSNIFPLDASFLVYWVTLEVFAPKKNIFSIIISECRPSLDTILFIYNYQADFVAISHKDCGDRQVSLWDARFKYM